MTSSTPPTNLANLELQEARAAIYWLIAAAFTEPQTERFELLRQVAFRESAEQAAIVLEKQASRWQDIQLGPGEGPPTSLAVPVLLQAVPATMEESMRDYAAVFGFTMAKDCPPHAIEYCANQNMFYRSQRLADIAGFFRAFGLERGNQHRDREDHIVYLAEFMAFLLTKQRYGEIHQHPAAKLKLVKDALRSFFRDHCGWWWPAFGRCLEAKAGAGSFYGCLAELLSGFTAWERHCFDLAPFKDCPEPKVPIFAPEGACFACGVKAEEPTLHSNTTPSSQSLNGS